MKKSLRCAAALLCAALLLSFSAAAVAADEGSSLYDEGLAVVDLMTEMIGSEAYVQMHSASDDISDVLDDIAAGDHTSPTAVYMLSGFDQYLAAIAPPGAFDGTSDALQKAVLHKTMASLITQVNARSGVTDLAAASICTAEKTFAAADAQDVIYLYAYEDAVPAAVIFCAGEDGTMHATGMFLVNSDLSTDSAESVAEFFGDAALTVTQTAP